MSPSFEALAQLTHRRPSTHPVVPFKHAETPAARLDPAALAGGRKLTGLDLVLTLSQPTKGLLVFLSFAPPLIQNESVGAVDVLTKNWRRIMLWHCVLRGLAADEHEPWDGLSLGRIEGRSLILVFLSL